MCRGPCDGAVSRSPDRRYCGCNRSGVFSDDQLSRQLRVSHASLRRHQETPMAKAKKRRRPPRKPSNNRGNGRFIPRVGTAIALTIVILISIDFIHAMWTGDKCESSAARNALMGALSVVLAF